ncbi:hypothetical protein BS78_09G099400 [Paspalum vaginatum]|nr:hypothetical protein BS78_09G099400 [Paspalum vaginatum]
MVAPRESTGTTSQQAPRRRGDIRFIEHSYRRQVTFSKYKKALFKMASELSREYGARVATVVFSAAGNTFAFGAPLLDGDAVDDDDREALEAAARRASEARARAAEEKARMDAVGKNVLLGAAAGGARFCWEADLEALGDEELREFARALRRLRDNVRRRADMLQLQLAPASQSQPTTQHQCLQLQ